MLLYLFIWEHFISRIIEYSFHKVTHQTAIVMVVLLVIMLAIGVSISVAVGLSSALAMLCMLDANISFATSAQRLFAGANSFSLIAIPFFILAGNIMNNGGIAERIVNVAKVVAGRMPGALAQSNVVANMLFGAISGSGAAAAAAMGGTIGPMEKKEGYDPVYSAGVNIASAPTGMLIPPSNLMIVYSTIARSVSVAALFTGGYVPGILWGLLVMFLAGVKAKKCGYVAERRIPAKDAIPSLLLIVIIIGGIMCGVFTATEASAVAVAYAFVLSLIYKKVNLKGMIKIVVDSAKMTGIITFMIGLSSIMSWVMAFTGLPDLIANGMLSITENRYVILILMNIILLIVGTFMDPTPAVLIFTPIFLPICQTFGMHPVQFGIMVTLNLCIGTITPPVGSILFTGAKVGNVKIEQVFKELLPYFGVILIVLLLTTCIPAISMTLPTAAGLIQ